MKPDVAAMQFEMPNSVPEYLGARSIWLMRYPE